MANNSINLISGDFQSVRNELINKLKGLPAWKDLVSSGVGDSLLRMFSWIFDVLTYRQNILANENFLETVQIKEDMLKLIKLLNYKPKRAIPSYGEVKLYLKSANSVNIVIPQGTRLTTINNISFYTLYENELLTGDKEIIVKVLQGLQKEENYKSDGTKNQIYILNSTNTDYYIGGKIWPNSDSEYSGIKVEVDNEEWEEVDSLVNYTSDDKVYKAELYSDYSVKIIFGDNELGKSPNSTSSIKFTYNLNIGKYGNVNNGSITSISDTINDINGRPITMFIEQSESFLNGGDPENIESIRANAPLYMKTGNIGITEEGYYSLISSNFANILDIYIKGEEDQIPPNFKAFNIITIGLLLADIDGTPLIPTNNGENYLSYYENVESLLKTESAMTVYRKYIIPEAVEILFNVNYKKLEGYSDSTTRSAIQTAIQAYLTENGHLSVLLKHSDIIARIEAITGLDYCYLQTKRSTDSSYGQLNIQLAETEFPSWGGITMTKL